MMIKGMNCKKILLHRYVIKFGEKCGLSCNFLLKFGLPTKKSGHPCHYEVTTLLLQKQMCHKILRVQTLWRVIRPHKKVFFRFVSQHFFFYVNLSYVSTRAALSNPKFLVVTFATFVATKTLLLPQYRE